MTGALVTEWLRRRRAFVAGSAIAAAGAIGAGVLLPIQDAAPLWALLLIACLVHASLHDTGDGAA